MCPPSDSNQALAHPNRSNLKRLKEFLVPKAIESFGRYILLEKLAAGGMAEVFLAKSVGAGGIGRFVAIKRILPQFSENTDFIAMFKEEAKLVMNLNHSNIVQIFDFGVENGQFYLAMEFVEGQNLRQSLNHMKKTEKEFSIAQVCYLVREIAAGLDHAHRCLDHSTGKPLNLVHRDMSPQNVMVSFEGEVKIVDFGIAKAETQVESTRTGTIKGKFSYMSPEHADGQVVDQRTDIFSLGIIFWELLAKERLFTGASEAAILKKIRDCQIPDLRRINPSIPPELEKVCRKALARDRNQRYTYADEMYKDLNRFLNQQYPDFAVREFAKFMKELFLELFQENREKLTAYAQVTHFSANAEATQVTHTQSEAGVTASANKRDGRTEVLTQAGASGEKKPDPLNLMNESSKVVDLTQLRRGNGENKSILVKKNPGGNLAGVPIPNALGNAGSAPNNQGLSSASSPSLQPSLTNTNFGHTNTRSKIRQVPLPYQRSSASKRVLYALGLLSLAGAVFWLKPEFVPVPLQGHWQKLALHLPPSPLAGQSTKVSPPFRGVNEAGTTEANNESAQLVTDASGKVVQGSSTPLPTVPLQVRSRPLGAQVYLNGARVGLTPWRGHVRQGEEFQLSIRSEGFLPFEINETVNSPDPILIEQTLQPQPPMSYLTIRVENATASTVVSINGRTVDSKLPIERWQVPADQELLIEVQDPFTGRSARRQLRLGASQQETLNLTLTSSSAGPSAGKGRDQRGEKGPDGRMRDGSRR